MIIIEPNKICYVFDVDGTLTDPREKVSQIFAQKFIDWSKDKQCFISTGSDYSKILEQLSETVLKSFKLIYCCMANEIRNSNGTILHKSHFRINNQLDDDLSDILRNSAYADQTGNHIEFRTGMVNFSIVGRNANFLQRKDYGEWDKKYNERKKIVNFINRKYSNLNASIGGSISIDIIEKGCDKGQTIHSLERAGAQKLVFVGDKCQPGGNDHGIIRELKKSSLAFEWYNVCGPNDTLELIKTNKVFGGDK